jgi:HD-GYP domain-containing protein (c-di-GMP phosphodiesterase class II)
MIKDFSKDEYDEFISLFSIPNVWHLIRKMLTEADSTFLDEGERDAFIALRLSEKEKIDMKNTRHLVFSALFHDIGSIWSTSSDESLKSFDFSTPYDRALSSYLFLKYFSPLKEYSDIVLFQHGRADRQQKNAYYSYGVKLNLCQYIDQCHTRGASKEDIIASIQRAAGSVFYRDDVEAMVSLLEETSLLEDLDAEKAHSDIDTFLSSLYFRRDVVRNYLFMVTYCFEFYNTETMFHARMTASLCYLLGRYLNLSLHDLSVLYTAGLFGDIGKVKVPREILEKPGPLSPAEYEIMRKHIDSTKEILTGCLQDKAVIDIAYAHHERIDGSGYPRGLKGDQLSLEQKIMAVADIGAAMMAKRAYKDAYPMEKTIGELERMKNEGKLDPQVVELFKSNQEEIFSYLQNHINRMLRDMQALRAERMRLKFADAWGK